MRRKTKFSISNPMPEIKNSQTITSVTGFKKFLSKNCLINALYMYNSDSKLILFVKERHFKNFTNLSANY